MTTRMTQHNVKKEYTHLPSADGLCADSSLLLSSPFSANERSERQIRPDVETHGC